MLTGVFYRIGGGTAEAKQPSKDRWQDRRLMRRTENDLLVPRAVMAAVIKAEGKENLVYAASLACLTRLDWTATSRGRSKNQREDDEEDEVLRGV